LKLSILVYVEKLLCGSFPKVSCKRN
jgi:hypothetical protein